MLDKLEDMLRIQADKKGLQMFFERAANVPRHIRTDELKLRQVLINLLNNAIKDRADNRQLLLKLLKTLEFELREAKNGQDAVEIWEEWEPHLVWMDMQMPVMDGYEATRIIKESAKGQATAVIAVTASADEEKQGVVLSAGCDDFVRKPFRESEIFDVMHRHLGVRYVYEEDADAHDPVSSEKARPKAVTPEDLGALPHELLAALEQASMHGDTDRVESLIEDIRTIDAALADALAVLVANFEHDNILRLIEKSRGG